MTTLADIRTEFEKYIVFRDKYALEMVLASVVGNLLVDRDPIWLMLVAPSSGGKTVLISPLTGLLSCHFCDDLTEKSLLSGFKVKGKEMSLLKIIGSGMMCISDYTAILGKNPISRNEILSQLRMVYDGNFIKRTGTGTIEWHGKIGMVAGCTPDIYTFLEESRSAGERYMYYWMEQPTDDEIVDKQQAVKMSSKDITGIMKDMYRDYFADINEWARKTTIPELKMTDAQRISARRAAIFCVNGKTVVRTDFRTGKPNAIPNKAGVGRDAKMFDTLLHTLQIMQCYEKQDETLGVEDWMIEVVEKCAYSSINRERRKIMEILVNHGSPMTASEIGAQQGLGLEKEGVEKYLTPLHAVGLVKKRTEGSRFKWVIDDEKTVDFVSRVSKFVIDNTHAEAIEVENETDLLEEYMSQAPLPEDEGIV